MDDDQDSPVAAVPESALRSLEEEIQETTDGRQPSLEEEAGCVGWTMFDTAQSNDGTVTVLFPRESLEAVTNQSLLRIHSNDGRRYLAAIVRGPFMEPDGLRADMPLVVTATVRGRGRILLPNYHGRAQVELLGEEVEGGTLVPPRRRPLPNSPVFLLERPEMARVLGSQGEIVLGLADGQEELEVRVPLKGREGKGVFPRHTGVLGTTGGGKSTTIASLIAQLQRQGAAVVLIDTEGEYTAIHEPTDDPHMVRALERRGLRPAGVPGTHLYHLVGRSTANPAHPERRPFSLRFSALSPYAVMEVLDLTDAQQERFLKAYDATKLLMERLGIFPSDDVDRERLLRLDEFEAGYPKMTLAYLYDVVKAIVAQLADGPPPRLETPLFAQQPAAVAEAVRAVAPPGHLMSWRALMGRLGRLKRLGVFDSPNAQPLDYSEMLRPGRVSIIDVSDTDSPQVNNLVIAELLRGLQRQQDRNYRLAQRRGEAPTPVILFIEEAHEFLSRERIARMPVLFQQVARLARRGRKRWLGLVFVTQLPQHLPDEVLGLVNNWVLHKVNDAAVVARLRRSIGGIDDALWGRLPNLAPGQAILSFTSLGRPLLAAIDPAPCKLRMTD